MRKQCLKIIPEESHSVDEQIIPAKTRYSNIRQYNPKKPVKWGFKNMVRAGSSGIMYDFYIYTGKGSTTDVPEDAKDLQKCAQAVAKVCLTLPTHANHKLFIDNWFTTLDLLLYLKERGIMSCGTVRANRLHGCPLKSNKELNKSGRGSLDYRSDVNSGVIVAKWLDNKPVHIASNFVGVEPMGSVERWCQKAKKRKKVQCPNMILMYNSGMGGVDLADMLIALYRIKVKTRRWYQKIFWHRQSECMVAVPSPLQPNESPKAKTAFIAEIHHCNCRRLNFSKQSSAWRNTWETWKAPQKKEYWRGNPSQMW